MHLDIALHRYPVYREDQSMPVAWFSNFFAAAASAQFRSAPVGHGGTGVPHYVGEPK